MAAKTKSVVNTRRAVRLERRLRVKAMSHSDSPVAMSSMPRHLGMNTGLSISKPRSAEKSTEAAAMTTTSTPPPNPFDDPAELREDGDGGNAHHQREQGQHAGHAVQPERGRSGTPSSE